MDRADIVFTAFVAIVAIVAPICVTVYQIDRSATEVEFAKAGLQECPKEGGQDTLWRRECD